MKVKMKFCGITRAEDIVCAAKLGVWGIGINAVPSSSRYVTPQAAIDLIAITLEHGLQPVLVVSGGVDAEWQDVLAQFPSVLVQYHGKEPVSLCEQSGYPYIKALTLDAFDQKAYPSAYALLIDAGSGGSPKGGSGDTWDWQAFDALDRRLLVAGGINTGNVVKAIRATRPWGVDVASGIESAPRIKSHALMHEFADLVASA